MFVHTANCFELSYVQTTIHEQVPTHLFSSECVGCVKCYAPKNVVLSSKKKKKMCGPRETLNKIKNRESSSPCI